MALALALIADTGLILCHRCPAVADGSADVHLSGRVTDVAFPRARLRARHRHRRQHPADRRVRRGQDGRGEMVGLRLDPVGCRLFPAG